MAKETKNQTGWKKIDQTLRFVGAVQRSGEFYITAQQIKEISGREPRLMAKFDHRVNLPAIFKTNHISILPVERNAYKLFSFDSFQNITAADAAHPIAGDFQETFQTVDIHDVRSEDKAVIIAHLSGMLDRFTGETDLRLTNKGKFGTDSFSFNIETNKGTLCVRVNGAGAELDAGLEGDKFYLLEAKMGKVEDFNIRQLYYPYRFWREKISKEIVPLFFTYSDNTFSLWRFRFRDDHHFNSLELTAHANYYIDTDPEPERDKVLAGIGTFRASDPPGVPFPQADDFEKVINIVELTAAGVSRKEDFADYFSFDLRQADYYFNAARYLDLVDLNTEGISLTPFGRQVAGAARNKRHAMLAEAVLSRKVFYDTFLEFENKDFNRERVTELMIENGVLADSTEKMRLRRAGTVISWCKWVYRILHRRRHPNDPPEQMALFTL